MATGALVAGLVLPQIAGASNTPPSLRPDMPDAIVSWRDDILTRDEYAARAEAWSAYLQDHPESAPARAMLYWARYYAGGHAAAELQQLLAEARELDPDCPEVLDAIMQTVVRSPEPMVDLEEAYRLGERAVAMAPRWATPHFTLLVLALRLGRGDEAEAHARALIEKGGIPSPLLDYAYNMLVGAEPDAVIFTNGDNDTYACLALQALRDLRPDVTVANLSLLNLIEIAEAEVGPREAGGCGAFTMEELEDFDVRFHRDYMETHETLADIILDEMCTRVLDGSRTDPVYVAVSVHPDHMASHEEEMRLEGVLWHVGVVPEAEREFRVDPARTEELFADVYRLDSATDLAFRWDTHSAVRAIVANYGIVLLHAAYAELAAMRADPERSDATARFLCDLGLDLARFHDDAAVLEQWTRIRSALDGEGMN